jgi:hypothetical protein
VRVLKTGFVLALALAASRAAAAEQAGTELLSGPYAIAPGADGATVCWQTTAKSAGAVRVRAEGSADWREVRESGSTRFHAVKLSGLAAGADHQVEVLSGPGGRKLGGLALRTAPARAGEFSFFVYGDTRSRPAEHLRVARAILAEAERLKQFTFVVHTGDLADGGSGEEEIARQFFRPAAALLERLPLVVARGNHETDGGLFKRYFPAPARAGFHEADDYLIDYGSLRLVVLEGGAPGETRGGRMNWLRDRLGEAADRWRLAAFHSPIYSRGGHGSDPDLRALLEPYLVAGRVHAVLCGHDHDYERSKPVGGVTHFVAGGGGAPLDLKPRGSPEWAGRFESTIHFLAVAVTPERLAIRALKPSAPGGAEFEVFDSVEIPRDCGWPAVDLAATPAVPYHLDELRRNPLKLGLLVGGSALLALALALKLIQRARKRPAGKAG